jgi:hypothetical protein
MNGVSLSLKMWICCLYGYNLNWLAFTPQTGHLTAHVRFSENALMLRYCTT